ncbi:hypothetical protein [Gordonia insulae]|uniref:Uncharacterized protein n=1 Tax=Gordonia insulae TaxID=2420509 RepID=A0A3G8JVN0_9ACTN|nr:hypothetical protein [Gordonia insulae]AZG48855.1 hypothetical protein D7316_05478 [Gordonia insulae]
MAVTAKMYSKGFEAVFNKEVDLDTDTIKVMLCTSSYTPNQSTHKYKSSVTNEASGTGYTAGGATLTSKTVGTSSLTFTFDAADVTWSSSTITARYAVFYVSTGSDATSTLLCYWDFGQDEVSSSGNFTLTISGSGIFTITAS